MSAARMKQHFRLMFLFHENSCSGFLNERRPRMLQSLEELEENAVKLDSTGKRAKISSEVFQSFMEDVQSPQDCLEEASEIDTWEKIHDSLFEGLLTSEKNKVILEMPFYPEMEIKTQREAEMELPSDEVAEIMEKGRRGCVVQ